MENKFFVCSDTYYIKEKVHPKNIRYVYINSNLNEQPTTNLDFDVELDSDFYSHIKYYRLVMDNGIPQVLYDIDGEKIGDCKDWYDFQNLMQKTKYKFYFTRDSNSNLYKSIAEAGIGVHVWTRKIAKQIAQEKIIENIEEYEEV